MALLGPQVGHGQGQQFTVLQPELGAHVAAKRFAPMHRGADRVGLNAVDDDVDVAAASFGEEYGAPPPRR